jgi:mRNA interferase MazF
MSANQPLRGEVWLLDLNPVQGREQAGSRPALVISVDQFNRGPAELVVVLPITSRYKGIPLHVRLTPPEGGVKRESFIKCEDVRSVSIERFTRRWGRVSTATLMAVEDRLRILMGL